MCTINVVINHIKKDHKRACLHYCSRDKQRLLENESSYFCADGSQQESKFLSRGNHNAAAGISNTCITVNFYPKSASSVYILYISWILLG